MQVHLLIAGEQDETHVRALTDPHRKILQRGGIDAFVMAVPKYVGLLLSLALSASLIDSDPWDR